MTCSILNIASQERPAAANDRRLSVPRPTPDTPQSPIARLGLDRRSRRVVVLLLGIIVLSLADLVITIAYLKANWMLEANPIVVYLIKATQSPWSLACYKALTVTICVALLFRTRRYLAGEVAAWLAMVILTVMSVMWHSYAQHFEDHSTIIMAHADAVDEHRLGLP